MILNFKKFGDKGDHLIILHGLFGMLDNWHTLATRFGKDFQVWTIDQRNHGKSPNSEDFDYDLLVQDIKDFYSQHGIEKAHLMGHSMGGKVVMQFATEHPDLVLKLIVADIAPRSYSGKGHELLMEALMGLDLNRITRRAEADEALKHEIPDTGTRQFLLKNLSREGDKYILKMNLDSLSKNFEKITGRIVLKNTFLHETLFIKGSESDYITEEDKEEIKKYFPNSRCVTIQGAGHWVHAEAPDRYYEIVMDFLNDVETNA